MQKSNVLVIIAVVTTCILQTLAVPVPGKKDLPENQQRLLASSSDSSSVDHKGKAISTHDSSLSLTKAHDGHITEGTRLLHDLAEAKKQSIEIAERDYMLGLVPNINGKEVNSYGEVTYAGTVKKVQELAPQVNAHHKLLVAHETELQSHQLKDMHQQTSQLRKSLEVAHGWTQNHPHQIFSKIEIEKGPMVENIGTYSDSFKKQKLAIENVMKENPIVQPKPKSKFARFHW